MVIGWLRGTDHRQGDISCPTDRVPPMDTIPDKMRRKVVVRGVLVPAFYFLRSMECCIFPKRVPG